MSEAASTDSTPPPASPTVTLRPGFGASTKTMSPSCSWAWSVIPTLTVPSASRFTHSCDSVYRRSCGTFMVVPSLVDENLALAHERRLHDLGRERLVANLHAHLVPRRGAEREGRDRDGAGERGGERGAGHLALPRPVVHVLGGGERARR